jgi:hypothetical protein
MSAIRPPKTVRVEAGISAPFTSASFLLTDELGAPAWLPVEDQPGARWRRIGIAGGSIREIVVWHIEGPTLLPQLWREPSDPRLGRPRLADTDPQRCEFAAWAHDVYGLTMVHIGHLLHPELEGYEEAQRKQAERDVAAGRERLHDDGVLPWAIYEEGSVAAEWPTSIRFEEGVQQWQVEAVTKPSPRPTLRSEAVCGELLAPLTQSLAATVQRIGEASSSAPDRAAQLRLLGRTPWRRPDLG